MYSDETNKFGKTYNTFLISDEDKNVYCLGLRDMCNKSSHTTLETFKEILSDISEVCNENIDNTIGDKILCNLQNFMSDRAKTNIAFTDLLVDYRKEIMPQILKSWDDLDFEQQDACCRVNNFFCGLHLLVNFAESSSSVLKNYESMCEKIDSSESFKDFYSLDFEENDDVNISKLDGHVITFLRFCAKCFGKGVDERNGCYADFCTYCRDKKERNSFISFRGNRFNVIFLMAEFAFFHKNHVLDFLDNVHGATNFVQKATLQLCKSNVVIAECKVLGLISKLITAPLWRVIERNKHVLDMNNYYELLLDFLKEQGQCAFVFINADKYPFEEALIVKDKFYDCLCIQDEKN